MLHGLPSEIEALSDEITKTGIFGRTVAHIINTLEFQKRGLPHAPHFSWCCCQTNLTPAQIDAIVCAELHGPGTEPHLYNIFSKVIIHRPCSIWNPNAVCIDRGKCTKGFPKPFSNETVMTAHGTYRHRNTGTHEIHAGGKGNSIDNRWVVPYNRYLNGRYECHINVEVCISVRAAKYITHKYIFKGHYRITAVLCSRMKSSSTWVQGGLVMQRQCTTFSISIHKRSGHQWRGYPPTSHSRRKDHQPCH